MVSAWPAASYEDWRATCDTLHAHTQVLGKLAVKLAPPEPELQHAALRLTARGWETAPLPAPDGSGALVVALDLHRHQAVIEHSAGLSDQVALTPNRPVGDVTREVLAAVGRLGGPVRIDPTPQEVPWSVPLDQDTEHAHYDPDEVARYFAAATQAALVLAAYRAPYRGRSTPVNAWWGSFDLAVSLFSGATADPPSQDFIMRNAMDSQEVAVGWWPGDARYPKAAFYAFAHPAPPGFSALSVSPAAAHWDSAPGGVHPGLGRHPVRAGPARCGFGVRPDGLPPGLPGLRLGQGLGRHRGRHATSGPVTSATSRSEKILNYPNGTWRYAFSTALMPTGRWR
jgi:hypothetical protein